MPDELDLRSRQRCLESTERRNWRGTETGRRSAATGGGSCAFSRVSTKICRCQGNRKNAGPWTKGGAPMARAVLTTLIFLAAALAAVENVAAQEAPPASDATPVPACNVAPRPEADLIALNASPSPVVESTALATTPMEMPEGDSPDAE